jgi:hypothetical protein
MGLFSRIFRRKKAQQLSTLQTKPLRRLGSRQYEYIAHCEMEWEGKPIRRLELSVKAPTGLVAETKIKKGLEIKVKKVYKVKRAK